MEYLLDVHNLKPIFGHGLSIIQCGYQQCLRAHTAPPKLYPHYTLTFILKGSGTYSSEDKTYKLHAGQGFLIPPNVHTSYSADADDPWHYIYVIFYGSDHNSILNSISLDSGNLTFNFSLEGDIIKHLFNMYECSKSHESNGYDVMGHFYLVIGRVAAESAMHQKNNSTEESYIKHAIAYIEDHYSYNISVQDISNAVCIDRTYLYKLFKNKYNRSPNQVLNDRRLIHAQDLLDSTDITLSEIAWSSGFYDLSHFSRVFKVKFGITPGEYRRIKDK